MSPLLSGLGQVGLGRQHPGSGGVVHRRGEAGRSGVRLSASLGHLVPRPVGAGDTAPPPAPSPLPVILRAPSSAVDRALQLSRGTLGKRSRAG